MIIPNQPSFDEGIEYLNTLIRMSRRTPAEIAYDADLDRDRLTMILKKCAFDLQPDEVIRLCIFGVYADFNQTDTALNHFNFDPLAKRSRDSRSSEKGRDLLRLYYEMKHKPPLREISDYAGGLDIGLISRIFSGERRPTRPVLIRLCGWGLACTLAETNAALIHFEFPPLSDRSYSVHRRLANR